MDTAFFTAKKIVALFTDPLRLTLLLCVVWWILSSLPRLQRWRSHGLWVVLLGLWVLSTPAGSSLIAEPLEPILPSPLTRAGEADGILVLACVHYENHNLELPDRYGECALRRVLYGVMLHRKTGLPLIFSGGHMEGKQISEAESSKSLAIAMGASPKAILLSPQGQDTATETAAVAKQWKGQTLMIVTTATHMSRSVYLLEQAGTQAIPAPIARTVFPDNLEWTSIESYIPSSKNLERSSAAIYEWLGLISKRFDR